MAYPRPNIYACSQARIAMKGVMCKTFMALVFLISVILQASAAPDASKDTPKARKGRIVNVLQSELQKNLVGDD